MNLHFIYRIFDFSKSVVMKGKATAFLALITLPLLLSFILSGCEDCYECGIDQEEPYFNAKFINRRRLLEVLDSISIAEEDRLAQRALIESSNDTLSGTINSFNNTEDADSLIMLQEMIDSIDNAIENLEKNVEKAVAEKARLDKIRKIIESGKVKIDSILSNGSSASKYIYFQDSMTVYQFPLPMNDGNNLSASYTIKMAGVDESITHTLEVAYSAELATENQAVINKADSLTYIMHTFDSVEIKYRNDLRLANETYLYLYF